MSSEENILILGLGTEGLSDRSIGLKLLPYLKTHFGYKKFDYACSVAAGFELIETLKDYDHTIIIDSIKTEDRNPGKVLLIDQPSCFNSIHINNPHEISLYDVLEFGQTIGYQMPGCISLITVEVEDIHTISLQLSVGISVRLDSIVNSVVTLINKALMYENNGIECYSDNSN